MPCFEALQVSRLNFSKENNEGELKLFNWLKNTDYKKNSVIVGNDSDLIILALAYRPLLNIYIYNYENFNRYKIGF